MIIFRDGKFYEQEEKEIKRPRIVLEYDLKLVGFVEAIMENAGYQNTSGEYLGNGKTHRSYQ